MSSSGNKLLAENQRMFRYANEKLRERIIDAGISDHRHIPFLCECADEGCEGRIEATLDEYAQAHFVRNQYFALPGHPRIESEESIEENGRYDVMRKTLE